MDDWTPRSRQYPAQHDERIWLQRNALWLVLIAAAALLLFYLGASNPEMGPALDSNSVAEECGVDGNRDC